MVLLIDNYDSFTWNLAQAIGALGVPVEVFRNDRLEVDAIAARGARALVISPGPGRPEQAGVSMATIERFSGKIPILGVCLGHQAIAASFGGKVVRAPRTMHGKVSKVLHDGWDILAGLPSPFEATRYHSLAVDPASLPDVLEVFAWTDEGEDSTIQAVRHRDHPTWGVQFHPESVSTPEGPTILSNFLVKAGLR